MFAEICNQQEDQLMIDDDHQQQQHQQQNSLRILSLSLSLSLSMSLFCLLNPARFCKDPCFREWASHPNSWTPTQFQSIHTTMKTQMLAHRNSPKSKTQGEEEQQQQKNKLHRSCKKSKNTKIQKEQKNNKLHRSCCSKKTGGIIILTVLSYYNFSYILWQILSLLHAAAGMGSRELACISQKNTRDWNHQHTRLSPMSKSKW